MATWRRPLDGGSLAAALLRASDWFNDALLERLTARGWPALSRGHALVFVNLDPDGISPAELSRRIGITRQSVQQLIVSLTEHDLIEVVEHPTDRRSRLVRLGPAGGRLARDAAAILGDLERELAERIGIDGVTALRDALSRPWNDDEPQRP